MPRAGKAATSSVIALDLGRRQPGHDLVEQHEARPQRERARDLEPLEQADRQHADRRVGVVGKADVGEHRLRRSRAPPRPMRSCSNALSATFSTTERWR